MTQCQRSEKYSANRWRPFFGNAVRVDVSPNQPQREAWNGGESVHYVDHAERYDRQLAPVTDALLARAALEHRHAVLDVGCGCGVTTLAAATHARSALGVDISDPLVRVAIERARIASANNADFLVADAQIHAFGGGTFDIVISQFGLMFFDDPVEAFSNLRRALITGGQIVFSTWQGLEANEWLGPVVRAIGQHVEVPDLGGLANGGGMFAFKDAAETSALLDAVGFLDITVEPFAPALLLGGGGSPDESADFLFGMGIVRGLLGRLDAEQRDSAMRDVRDELRRRHEAGVGVRLGAGVWLVSARS
jgi:ubiquinone/menaquinone biosynthesis C-methylase UbiE